MFTITPDAFDFDFDFDFDVESTAERKELDTYRVSRITKEEQQKKEGRKASGAVGEADGSEIDGVERCWCRSS